MGQCFLGRASGGSQGQQKPRRGSLSLRQNHQVYHLNHIECLPYQGRRSRYSTQSSSFLGLMTRQNSAAHSTVSTRQNSMTGSQPVLLQDSDLALNRDSPLAGSNPVLAHKQQQQQRRHSGVVGSDDVAGGSPHQLRRRSLAELQRGLSYEDYRRSGCGRVFRSYLDYQAVRQSYLQAVSQESLLEGSGDEGEGGGEGEGEGGGQYKRQSTQSLSMSGFQLSCHSNLSTHMQKHVYSILAKIYKRKKERK